MALKPRTYNSNEELIGIERFHNLRKRLPLIDNFTPISEVPSAWLRFIEPKIKRFPAEDPKGGCWIWQGAVDADGHPVMMTTDLTGRRGQRRVARWVAAFFYELPSTVVVVSHHCRNVTCVRPSHLELHFNDDYRRIPTFISRVSPNDISNIRPGIDDRRKLSRSSTENDKADHGHDTHDTNRADNSWVSVAEAIKLLGIGRASFYRYREKELIIPPPCRHGKQLFYLRSYIEDLAGDMKYRNLNRGRGHGWGV